MSTSVKSTKTTLLLRAVVRLTNTNAPKLDLTAEAEDTDRVDRVVGDAEGLVTLEPVEATGGTIGEGIFVFLSDFCFSIDFRVDFLREWDFRGL